MLDFLCKYLKISIDCTTDIWPMAVLGLFQRINGLDHWSLAHKNHKLEKRTGRRTRWTVLVLLDSLMIHNESNCKNWPYSCNWPFKESQWFRLYKWTLEIQKCAFICLNFFANISKSVMNQRMIFGLLVVLGLLNIIISLDLACGSHKL